MGHWPEHEELLSRFGNWLEETRGEAAAPDTEEDSALGNPPSAAVGLYQLVEQLTALRHEIKLLTKASRSGEERNEATLLSMQAAIEQFRSVKAAETDTPDNARRPLVEALVDLDESLVRGRRVIETARQRVLAETTTEQSELRQQLDQLYKTQPWWRRWLCRPWHVATKAIYAGRAIDTQRNILDSLLEGYELIQGRLRRSMDEQAIIRMDCVGKQVDPNCMTVLEVVSDPSRPSGMVTEEVRPGYYSDGKVFRFAEVKAVAQR